MRRLSHLDAAAIDGDKALRFPLAALRQGPALPLRHGDGDEAGRLPLAIADGRPWPWMLMDDFRRIFGLEIEPVLVPEQQIIDELNRVFDMASASAEQMLEDFDGPDELSREFEEAGDLLDSRDEAPVIRLINSLISQAMKERASDIHIEPFENHVLVRFRVDGVLHTVVQPPKGAQAAMTSRIKVMGGMDIAEKRHPQDGRFRVRIAGREVDVRVSILPTAHGERVVMRLLNRSDALLSLPKLGMSDTHLTMMEQALHSPHGIVLVTGPTGSGKSTTLYAGLMSIDRSNRNVLTIEDPIEYQLQDVGQMQVQSKIGVTFAAGLRSILRQDPDIVMIGEIRDLETAEIAIQASLTGHLVLSTLHTNDALAAIVRLQDMGVEPYLVASSLILVQAQRLVRRLCPHCRQPRDVREDDAPLLGVDTTFFAAAPQLYDAVGCEQCMQTGYRGRIGIYEVAPVSDAIRTLIHEHAGLSALRRQALNEGMTGLRQDGARHVLAGETTVDEVLRVTRADEVVVEA
jgi:general secretion pathway protein E